MSAQESKGPPPFDALEIGLTMPRDALYRAVDDRVRDQIERGLVAEVRSLLESGVPESAPAMSSLGYRQLLPYIRGESSLEQAIERIRHDTHRYVRHQETWLRRNPRLIWFDVTTPEWMTAAKSESGVPERVDASAFPAPCPVVAVRSRLASLATSCLTTPGSQVPEPVDSLPIMHEARILPTRDCRPGRARRKGSLDRQAYVEHIIDHYREPAKQGPHGGRQRPARRRQSWLRRPHHHVRQGR